jgi:hypothetical protein
MYVGLIPVIGNENKAKKIDKTLIFERVFCLDP